jgi:hypothetical protein
MKLAIGDQDGEYCTVEEGPDDELIRLKPEVQGARNLLASGEASRGKSADELAKQ